MKLYADLDNLEDITNNALIKISRKNAKPELIELVDLCSLADHDKQVRKEVCEEIRKMLPDFIYNFQEPEVPRTKVIELEDVKYILDKIQGETNVKDN